MEVYIISGAWKRSEREYRLPSRCPRCHSRDIVAEAVDGFVRETCYHCDHNAQWRLIRTEVRQ